MNKSCLVFLLILLLTLLVGCGSVKEDGKPSVAFGCEDPTYDHVEYLGVYVYDQQRMAEIASFSNVVYAHSVSNAMAALDLGLRVFVRLYVPLDTTTKLINWPVWESVVNSMEPIIDRIEGFYMHDEPHIHGIYIDDLEIMLDVILDYFPLTPLWLNYDWDNAWRPIPNRVDYISVTPAYDESPGKVYQSFVNEIKANMHPGQKMFLIGDGFNWDAGRPVPPAWQEYKADTSRDYQLIMGCDIDIVGIFTYAYQEWDAYTGLFDMPLQQDAMELIYDEIIN